MNHLFAVVWRGACRKEKRTGSHLKQVNQRNKCASSHKALVHGQPDRDAPYLCTAILGYQRPAGRQVGLSPYANVPVKIYQPRTELGVRTRGSDRQIWNRRMKISSKSSANGGSQRLCKPWCLSDQKLEFVWCLKWPMVSSGWWLMVPSFHSFRTNEELVIFRTCLCLLLANVKI